MTSAAVKPVGGTGGAAAHVLTLDDGLERTSGIRSNTIASGRGRATILRRPETRDLVGRNWQGQWTFNPADEKPGADVRIYRIPDFLLRLELDPELPWWRHEQVRLKARLLDRHKRMPDPRTAASSASGEDLSVRLRIGSAEETNSFVVERGEWTVPGQLYEVEPFTIGVPGLYKLACDVRHSLADANIPVLRLTSDAYVHSECVSMQAVSVATDQVLREVPPIPATVPIDSEGGQEVYFRVVGRGEFNVEPLSGVLYLEPLSQTAWPLRKDEGGNLITGPITLVEREERLTGWAQVDVQTFVGVRHIQLPLFELTYAPAPLRVETAFTDSREALWVGEFHRQLLSISAFPVFDRFLERALGLFPETLPETRIRTVNMRSGMTQVLEPDSRLLEPPRAGGYEGRTVTATYFVESAIPVPPADKCEIDLRGTVADLEDAVKSYAVVDPVAEGLFQWTVQQGTPDDQQGAVSEVLFCGEPVRFSAQWRADQKVSAVRFEIPQPDGTDSLFVDLPVTAGSNTARLEQVVRGLNPGRDIPVYVHLTMKPDGVGRSLEIKLAGGQFNGEDRRIVLEELIIGETAPSDIPGYAWEPVEIPLLAVFSGYDSSDPRHNAVIEQFKQSCVVTVTARAGETRDITDTIEWTAVVPVEGLDKMCRLAGRAAYTPDVAGRVAIELDAGASTGSSVQHAYAHVLVRDPRLAVTVHRLTPGEAEPVFDSRKWVRGDGGLSALTTRFSTRLQVDMRASNWTVTGQSQPWQTTMRLMRRAASNAEWLTEFSETGELAAKGSLARDIQITGNGEYALEVVGHDPQSGHRVVYFQSPVIAAVQPHEVKPAVAPPAWLTSRVRQWPFEYLVTLSQDGADWSQTQTVSFQFQLPGQQDAWLDGATPAVESDDPDSRRLSARAPRFLPAVDGLQNGTAQFRLATQGLEFLRWQCPNIRVIPPVLEGLALSRTSHGGSLATNGAELAFDGTTDLWARPLFRAAPELEGQWVPSGMTVYLWSDRNGGSAGRPADVRILERLQGQGSAEVPNSDIRLVELAADGTDRSAKVLPRRVRRTFWGWPKSASHERYSLVAAVVFRATEMADAASTASGGIPGNRMIAEWTDVYAVNLDTPWVVPLVWWFLAAGLVATVVAAALRLFVPSPGRLALDMRLEENVAVVEPVRHDNPVLVDLHETSLGTELRLFGRYLCSQWDLAGQAMARRAGFKPGSAMSTALGTIARGIAWGVAPVRVLLRRMLYPRRWAWTAIRPRVRGDARLARQALLCVWTGPGARNGRAWSSQSGSLDLPERGQFRSINLDLPYRVDRVDRTMRVTVRVTRMAPERTELRQEARSGSGV